MSRNCQTKSTRTGVGLLAALLFAVVAIPLGAYAAPDSRVGRGLGPVYDSAHEITFNGTIQKVVTERVAGTPPGMHLLLSGPQGQVDAHLGPYMSKETKQALQSGTSVKIVGAMLSGRGKTYLLARQLVVGSTTVTVRSEHGFLVRGHATGAHRSTSPKTSKDGGAR
jgi:hypothetical protein